MGKITIRILAKRFAEYDAQFHVNVGKHRGLLERLAGGGVAIITGKDSNDKKIKYYIRKGDVVQVLTEESHSHYSESHRVIG